MGLPNSSVQGVCVEGSSPSLWSLVLVLATAGMGNGEQLWGPEHEGRIPW